MAEAAAEGVDGEFDWVSKVRVSSRSPTSARLAQHVAARQRVEEVLDAPAAGRGRELALGPELDVSADQGLLGASVGTSGSRGRPWPGR